VNRLLCAAALTLACLAGCSPSPVSKADLTAAEAAVKSGLEAWKKGEKPKQLESSPTPMQFTDEDWQGGAKLVGYQIVKVYGQSDGIARCAVKLELEVRQRGKAGLVPTVKEATYHVVLRPKVVVARDPMA
jgi:hypothetical protein